MMSRYGVRAQSFWGPPTIVIQLHAKRAMLVMSRVFKRLGRSHYSVLRNITIPEEAAKFTRYTKGSTLGFPWTGFLLDCSGAANRPVVPHT